MTFENKFTGKKEKEKVVFGGEQLSKDTSSERRAKKDRWVYSIF